MLPANKQPFEISRPALTIVVAAILLAALLATLTIGNIRREENLMESYLLRAGLTLIRSFEAGARTTMMHHMQGADSLKTLVTETVKEPSVAYIRIVERGGQIIASSGAWPQTSRPSLNAILSSQSPVITQLTDKKIFEIASPFKPISVKNRRKHNHDRMRMMKDMGSNCDVNSKWAVSQQPQIIYLGLRTDKFELARRVDIKHALLLGGILFLVGSAGLYFLFLYQNIRVVRNTLADMEIYTNNVIESMPDGLITLDTQGRVVSCNKQAESITGKSFAELKGKVLSNELAGCPIMSGTPTIVCDSDEIIIEQPFSCIHADGSSVPVKISAAILHDGSGRISGQVVIIRDVREIIEIEQKLEQSRRLSALGRMAAGIAHEIRNPLGTLRGFAQLFVTKFADKSSEQEYAMMMVDEVDRLNRTVSALLQFSRPREPEFQQVSLNEIMGKTVKFMSTDFKNKSVDFHLKMPPTDIFLYADPDFMEQVLLNLLHNALAASNSGGMIELGAISRGNDTLLWVADNGHGMSQADKERMFDPFFTTRKTGTGLGLAVVHQIISQHGGVIEVDSTPEQGTRVEIIFPQPERNKG